TRDARLRRSGQRAGGARGGAGRLSAQPAAAVAVLHRVGARRARQGRADARDLAARDRDRAPRRVRGGRGDPRAHPQARPEPQRGQAEAVPVTPNPPRLRARAVGIDLGTSNSVVAVIDTDGAPRILTTAEGSTTMPSLVWFSPDGPVIGEAARAGLD